MSDNPYAYSADVDDDLLGEGARPNRKHDLTGAECEHCGHVHDIQIGEDIPPEILDKLSEIIDGLPEEILTSEIIVTRNTPQTRILHDFVEFANHAQGGNRNAPLMRAMAEVLDELTDGAVNKRWKVYAAERELTISHVILKAVNNLVEGGRAAIEERGLTVDDDIVLKLLTKIMEMSTDRLERTVATYREAGEEAGMHIDEKLIECGIYSDEYAETFSPLMKNLIDRRNEEKRGPGIISEVLNVPAPKRDDDS